MLYNLSSQNSKEINNMLKTQTCVVFYYWNYCGYCQQIKPIWDKVTKKYAKSTSIHIINVEVDHLELLRAKYKKNISGVPTIIKYSKSKRIQEFTGRRIFKDLDDFVKEKIPKTK